MGRESVSLGVHGGKNGFNLSEFDELINQLEQFGADMNQVAEHVLDAGSEPARQAFEKVVPFDEDTPQDKRTHEHARNTVSVTRTRTAKKTKNRYRLVEAKTTKKDKTAKKSLISIMLNMVVHRLRHTPG
jgi:hypothetical protein